MGCEDGSGSRKRPIAGPGTNGAEASGTANMELVSPLIMLYQLQKLSRYW